MIKSVTAEMAAITFAKILVIVIAAALGPFLYRFLFGKNESTDKAPAGNTVTLIGALGFTFLFIFVCCIGDIIEGNFNVIEPIYVAAVLVTVIILVIRKKRKKAKDKPKAEISASDLNPEGQNVLPVQDAEKEESRESD